MWRNLPSTPDGVALPVDRSAPPAAASVAPDAMSAAGHDPAGAAVVADPTVTPDLTGMSASEARRVARLVGLQVDIVERPAHDALWGRVLGQDPAAGSTASHGDIVSLVVGGRPHVLVPELRGRDEAEAVAALHAVGLTPERRATRRSDKVPEGHVLRTRPRSATEVPVGSRVAYVVAAGPRAKAGHARRERQRARAGRQPDGSFMTLPER